MYTKFYGLNANPFNVNPDPQFLFPSEDHQEGLARMMYGVRMRKGLLVLTGEAGTGKTTLVHSLLRNLGEDTVSAWVFNTTLESDDLLRYVCRDFGVTVQSENKAELLLEMYQFLIANFEKRRNALLIVDEAQNLTPRSLEEIRLLTNLETSKTKLVQILLAGQPPLENVLNLPELRQFRQRITLRHRLHPLDREQVGNYIQHRMKVAGVLYRSIFTQSAIDEIYRYSGGIPRLVNHICDNALLHGFINSIPKISDKIIESLQKNGTFLEPESEIYAKIGKEKPDISHSEEHFESIDFGVFAKKTNIA